MHVIRRIVVSATIALVATATLAAATGAASAAAAADRRPQFLTAPHRHAGVKLINPGAHVSAGGTLSIHSSARKGVVIPKPKVYLVFWGKQWSNDPKGAAPALQAFFQGLFGSADTWGTILNQYCEDVPQGTTDCGSLGKHIKHPTSTPLAGSWFDNAANAPSNATSAQIAAEAIAAAQHFGNITPKSNLNAQYVIASASGTHPDGFPNSGFCGWHDWKSSQFGGLAYTNLPYVPDINASSCTTLSPAGPLDGYFSTESHEYAEVLTDPHPFLGWLGPGSEIADECIQLDARLTLSTGTFDVQGLWSNERNACRTQK